MKFFSKILAPSIFLFSIMCARDLRMGEKAVAPWKGRDWVIYVDRITKQNFFNPATDKIIVENKGVKNDAATYAAYTKMYNAYPALATEYDPTLLQNIIKAVDVPLVSTTYPALPFPPPSLSSGGMTAAVTPISGAGTPSTAPIMPPATSTVSAPSVVTPPSAIIAPPTPTSISSASVAGGTIPVAPPPPSGFVPVEPPAPVVPSSLFPSASSAPAASPAPSTSIASSFGGGSAIGARAGIAPTPAAAIALPAVAAISAAEREKLIAQERKKLEADPSVTLEVKRKSDIAVLDAFGDIAGEVGVTRDLKKGDLKEYLKFIGTRLKKLYDNSAFKFKNALAYNFFNNGNVASLDVSTSPFDNLVTLLLLPADQDGANKKLEQLYTDVAVQNDIRKKLINLIDSCVFNVDVRTINGVAQKTENIVPEVADLMWVNIVVSQRSEDEESYDGVSQELLKHLRELVSHNNSDILKIFAHELNMLRLNLYFKKFFGLLGNAATEKIKRASPLPGQVRLFPLLEALRTDHYPALGEAEVNQVFTTVNFPKMVRGEIFHDPAEHYDNAAGLHVNVPDSYFAERKRYLSELLGGSDASSLVKKLSSVKNINDVEKNITALKKSLPLQEKEIQQVVEFIAQAKKDVQQIPANYSGKIEKALSDIFAQALPGKKADYDGAVKNVTTILDELYKKEAIPIELKAIIKNAYSSPNPWVAIKSAIDTNKVIPAARKQRVMSELLSPYVTDATLFEILSPLVGGKTNLEKVFNEAFTELFPDKNEQNKKREQIGTARNLLELVAHPYGLITVALKDADEKIDPTEKPDGQIERLLQELRAIYDGKVGGLVKMHKAFKNVSQPGAVKSIEIGIYRNNPQLKEVISALEKYDIETALNLIKNIVTEAQPAVSGLDEQVLLIKNKLFVLMSQVLKAQLEQANMGKLMFEGLPLKGADRVLIKDNFDFYKKLNGLFKPVLDILAKENAFVSTTDAQIEKIIEEIVNGVPVAPVARGKELVRAYLESIKDKILNLQKTAKIIAAKQNAIRVAEEEEKKRKEEEAKAAAASPSRPGSPTPSEEPEMGPGGVPVAPPPPGSEEEEGGVPVAPPLPIV